MYPASRTFSYGTYALYREELKQKEKRLCSQGAHYDTRDSQQNSGNASNSLIVKIKKN